MISHDMSLLPYSKLSPLFGSMVLGKTSSLSGSVFFENYFSISLRISLRISLVPRVFAYQPRKTWLLHFYDNGLTHFVV